MISNCPPRASTYLRSVLTYMSIRPSSFETAVWFTFRSRARSCWLMANHSQITRTGAQNSYMGNSLGVDPH